MILMHSIADNEYMYVLWTITFTKISAVSVTCESSSFAQTHLCMLIWYSITIVAIIINY